ncbi:mannosyl-oligosaccharide alpha-1,2-mannosidase-like protein [Mytilinidion resinicola]|uniref:alpha-1,2-Mannosidase n=1 Tax=Mytilinidion resinicola TaxID=574789 RepID=A0A6A6YA27_9PEZI|nr:mannosyl-oligosaccharide alpha-1,2-mannosidase-like protein [Mytilinidion resinicola]KAF2805479.1 mannosyl-oligosaccharide alpha-1,2-mannosidase-like protein [Mytilinidion resinicola]
MPSFRRNPTSSFKLLAAFLIITFYLVIRGFSGSESSSHKRRHAPLGAHIQFEGWKNGSGHADEEKATQVREAMKHTFSKYREYAWGYDDIKPVSGGNGTSRNGWGAFIVDTASTLALMGMWDELELEVDHIIDKVNFTTAYGLVDPFETTIRYLGGLLSVVDLIDAGTVPPGIIINSKRDALLAQAITLADKLAPSFDTPTGMVWPRVNFTTNEGSPDPPSVYLLDPSKPRYKNPSIGPARAGSNILENRVLSRLTGNVAYVNNATRAWAPLVWNKFDTPWPGMVDAPIDIITGAPVGRVRHWDAGHDSYYEYLIKVALLAQGDLYTPFYQNVWTDAVTALRHHLASRSAPQDNHKKQHVFMGKQEAGWFINEQSHLSCFAAGNIMLGARFLNHPNFLTLGQALLEGCRHVYASTPTHIGPETWSWIPKFGYGNATFHPSSDRQLQELNDTGIWMADAQFKLRPEYVESLFYGYRITGEERYRDWAWDAFRAFERHCKTKFGYAGLRDVTLRGGESNWKDEQESFWGAETLKYLWLIFKDPSVGSLDKWVYSTEGHLFRMIR